MKKIGRKRFISTVGMASFSAIIPPVKSFSQAPGAGPFFGNGMRNGWADQESIVIWTRLTKMPDLNRDGTPFLSPDRVSVNEFLEKGQVYEASIRDLQMPKGARLEDMDGACPGSDGEVKLIWYPEESPSLSKETRWEAVDKNRDYTKQWRLNNLKAGTRYSVTLKARKTGSLEVSHEITGKFQTPPKETRPQDVSFCIVTCHGHNKRDNREGGHEIYRSMLVKKPDFYVHTGDVEYYDVEYPWALTEDLMRFKWNRLFGLPFQRNFFRQVTSYFMKDDHDTLCNDCSPGDRYGLVSFERGLEIFDKEQFPTVDKTYKTVCWGKDLQIWLLEGRNYRSHNKMEDGPDKTVLGKEQRAWLFETVEKSTATFKLIINPTPILGPDHSAKADNHANKGFKYEGDLLRNFFSKQKNLYLCNGDRHWQYVTHWKEEDLWEFCSGAGSDFVSMGWTGGGHPNHEFFRLMGGFLYGRVFRENGLTKLNLNICNVDGKVLYTKVFETA